MTDNRLNEIRKKIELLRKKAKIIKQSTEESKYDGEAVFPIKLEYTSKSNLMRFNHHLKYDFTPYTTMGLGIGSYHSKTSDMVAPCLTQMEGIVLNIGNVKKPKHEKYKITIIIEPILKDGGKEE